MSNITTSNTMGAVLNNLTLWQLHTQDCFIKMEQEELCVVFVRYSIGVELSVYIQPSPKGNLPTTLVDLEQLVTTEHTFRVWNYVYNTTLRQPTAQQLIEVITDSIY